MKANHYRTIFIGSLCLVLILLSTFSTTSLTYAATASPFVGTWYAPDWDGSEPRLVIAGRSSGPFKITITDNTISFCDGGPGIIRGNGWLNPENPDLLEADLRLVCSKLGKILDYHSTWRYHQNTNMLSSGWQDGYLMIWHKYGQPVPPPTLLKLIANYYGNWVDGVYESGHTAWVTVTESDGVTVKAHAELTTEDWNYWWGESGFATNPSGWVPQQPDILPGDWVYAWIDNGASTKLQIGEINGMINLFADSIEGTINAPWFFENVEVQCFFKSAPQQEDDIRYDTVLPDGMDVYNCSWESYWDILPGQRVGVAYIDQEANWVINVFRAPNPTFAIYPETENIEGSDWLNGATVYASVSGKPECATAGVAGYPEGDPSRTFVGMSFPEGCDVVVGDIVTLTDETTTRTHIVQNLAIMKMDPILDIVDGTADVGALVYSYVPEYYGQTYMEIMVENGTWTADFAAVGFDLQEGMSGRAEVRDAVGNSTAVDWYISLPPNPTFAIYPETENIEGSDWLNGATVYASVSGKPECATAGVAGYPEGDPSRTFVGMSFPEGCDVVVGDIVTLTDETTTRTHIVQNLAIMKMDPILDIVDGTADVGALVYSYVPEYYGQTYMEIMVENGTWTADFAAVGFDLQEGMSGRAEVRDAVGNSTVIDWYVLSTL